jgi:cytidylate kinase
MDTPSTLIGPGLGAFIAFFVLAVALWLLMRNMNGRMRRMAYREQQRIAELEARDAEREAAQGQRKQTRSERRSADRSSREEGGPQAAPSEDPAP